MFSASLSVSLGSSLLLWECDPAGLEKGNGSHWAPSLLDMREAFRAKLDLHVPFNSEHSNFFFFRVASLMNDEYGVMRTAQQHRHSLPVTQSTQI